MAYDRTLREEEVKNKLRSDYFKDYDATPVLGDIDFAVAVPCDGPRSFETEYLLWAESKKGTHADIYESFVQLILTIGKARTFDKHLPPAFLGAFDSEKIAFIPYNAVMGIFYQNDFNWKVAPSDHTTKEFRQVLSAVRETLERGILLFPLADGGKELRRFIRENFKPGKSGLSKIRVGRNNFTHIYQKWLDSVRPTIGVNWDKAKTQGILDADFYLADILSEHNMTLKEKLFVVLQKDHYEIGRQIDDTGMFKYRQAEFSDKGAAHARFWNRYERPPKREYWDYIIERRDLLVPQDIRERKGSYFTPRMWAELSQDYLARELGEDWQQEYAVWDCAAGTGNLLAGLTNKYNIWASTIDKADVAVMRDRIRNGAGLLDSQVFQFDFLNDPFDRLPQKLRDIIEDPERRKKLVVYINPPFGEAASATTVTGTGKNKPGITKDSAMARKYGKQISGASNELFALFFIRIAKEIPGCILAEFSTLKILQGKNFADFRGAFACALRSLFVAPSYTFDNVGGNFPIGFFIWDTGARGQLETVSADVYDKHAKFAGHKNFYTKLPERITKWIKQFDRPTDSDHVIGYVPGCPPDFQHNKQLAILSKPQKRYCLNITSENLMVFCIYFSVRHCIESTWLNDRDQFLWPDDSWQEDSEFRNDCLAYALFHSQNLISGAAGVNHWIPFTEEEADARETFRSRFMAGFIRGGRPAPCRGVGFFAQSAAAPPQQPAPLEFSPEAAAVFDAGRRLWRYYHSQPGARADASLYDMRLFFQGRGSAGRMSAGSPDKRYSSLAAALRAAEKALAAKIRPAVFRHGFLRP